jgi:outer membrane receptor protein involved in Fe transport
MGYLNEVHAHAWDFVDQPLVYQAFYGGQLAQDGVQLKWLAPTDLFIEIGAETGNGQAFPGTRRGRNGFNGASAYAHVGGDFGASTSWRMGASWLELHAEDRAFEDVNELDEPVLNSFTGKSRTWGMDAILKWSPSGNTGRQQLKVQGEYMRRTEDGELTFDAEGLGLSDAYRSEQSGWYLQSVFQFRPRWRIGLRYDALDSGSPRDADPDRISMMLDWSPSEFSRLRAQYAWDDARDDGRRDRQLRLQYLYGIGAHGAHKY